MTFPAINIHLQGISQPRWTSRESLLDSMAAPTPTARKDITWSWEPRLDLTAPGVLVKLWLENHVSTVAGEGPKKKMIRFKLIQKISNISKLITVSDVICMV